MKRKKVSIPVTVTKIEGGHAIIIDPSVGMKREEPDLLSLLDGVKLSFSPWCRSGLIGDDCICDRCLRAKGLVGDDGKTEAREKEAERLARLLDRAYEAGRTFGKLQAGMGLPPEIVAEIAALKAQDDEKQNDPSKIDDTPE